MWLIILLVCPLVLLLLHYFTAPWTESWRKRTFLRGPLGLRKPAHRDLKEHAILHLDPQIHTFEDYLKTVNRDMRRNLTTNIAKSFLTHDIVAKSVSGKEFGRRHFWVVYDHQLRVVGNRALAAIAALGRCWAFWFTCWGGMDEIYVRTEVLERLQRGEKIEPSKNQPNQLLSLFSQRVLSPQHPIPEYTLVCFAQPIIKGKTIRGMWFYQRSSASRLSLFHFLHQANMKRGFSMGLECLDAGPSPIGQRTGKEKLGYRFTREYLSYYEGDYVDPPPLHLIETSISSSPKPST